MKKVIIFSEFSEMCKILYRELQKYKPLMIIGETPNKNRQEIVKKFNIDTENKILIMSNAGSYGLNLQAASIIIHYDNPWSLAKVLQREGRAHRYGQKDTVMVYNLLAKGTLDYYVQKVLHGKAELSSQLLGDKPISIDDIKEMLSYE